MNILFINDPNPQGQDQLADSLLHGFVRAFGQAKVREFFGHRRYCSEEKYLQDWPIHLGALAYGNNFSAPSSDRGIYYDAVIVNTRALAHEAALDKVLVSDPRRLVFISSGDSPEMPAQLPFRPALVVHRPGNAWRDHKNLELFISVPSEWFWYHWGHGSFGPDGLSVYAAMSDNHPFRRHVLQTLVNAAIPGALLRFGSGQGYRIDGTRNTVPVPRFLRELSKARTVVNARGGNIDTMCVSEAFIAKRLLITDDFGGAACYRDGKHLFYYTDPHDAVSKALWADKHRDAAQAMALAGSAFYQERHTPELQAVMIMKAADLL